MDNHKEPRVVVVGAGLAGIGASTRLYELGFRDVSLLEGSDRVGGRTRSREFGRGIIDLGATWIHGPSPGNAVFRVASAHGLLEDGDDRAMRQAAVGKAHSKGARPLAYWTNLGRTNDVKAEAASSYYEELIEDVQKMFRSDQEVHSKHAGLSVGQYIKQQVAKRVADEWSKDDEELLRIKLGTLSMRLKEEASISGANSMDQVDLISFGEYVALPGEDCVFPRGYSSLVDSLLQRFPRERVLLNKNVQCINWAGMDCKDGQSRVRVTCEGGESFFADHVIVTVPLGYLKNHHSTMFEPSLPTSKVEALENLGFGTVNKIFLEFSEPFWNAGLEYVRLVWDDESPLKVKQQQFPLEWERKIQGFQVLQPPERSPSCCLPVKQRTGISTLRPTVLYPVGGEKRSGLPYFMAVSKTTRKNGAQVRPDHLVLNWRRPSRKS
uniref:peroxisomal N(1)-acetyl-spermine/spermidine oxidase isoform X2 n=1 Tax=Myxine glutinosa TaxID=7769 RepID=UPI00358F0DD8